MSYKLRHILKQTQKNIGLKIIKISCSLPKNWFIALEGILLFFVPCVLARPLI